MEKFISLNKDCILEDSNDFFNPMAQIVEPPTHATS